MKPRHIGMGAPELHLELHLSSHLRPKRPALSSSCAKGLWVVMGRGSGAPWLSDTYAGTSQGFSFVLLGNTGMEIKRRILLEAWVINARRSGATQGTDAQAA